MSSRTFQGPRDSDSEYEGECIDLDFDAALSPISTDTDLPVFPSSVLGGGAMTLASDVLARVCAIMGYGNDPRPMPT